MAKADARAVKRRVQRIKKALKPVAQAAMRRAAQDTINAVEESAYRKLAHRTDQVGFDLFQFIENIQGVSDTGGGGVAILDTNRMGTIDDFEEIADEPGLWHQGTGSGEKFRKSVYRHPHVQDVVAELRTSVWNERTPQWILMEYGSHTGGEYPPVPAAHFIGAVKDDANRILEKWKRSIKDELDASGING